MHQQKEQGTLVNSGNKAGDQGLSETNGVLGGEGVTTLLCLGRHLESPKLSALGILGCVLATEHREVGAHGITALFLVVGVCAKTLAALIGRKKEVCHWSADEGNGGVS